MYRLDDQELVKLTPQFAVVETSKGVVQQVLFCADDEEAEAVAIQLCHTNGIVFAGKVSVDGDVCVYSVQIFPIKNGRLITEQ